MLPVNFYGHVEETAHGKKWVNTQVYNITPCQPDVVCHVMFVQLLELLKIWRLFVLPIKKVVFV